MSRSGANLSAQFAPGAVPAGLTGNAGYDRIRNLYNAKPAQLTRIRAALAKGRAGVSSPVIVILGASNESGGTAGAGVRGISDWPTQLGVALCASGAGSPPGTPSANVGEFIGAFAGGGITDARVTPGAGWGNSTLTTPIEYCPVGTVTKYTFAHLKAATSHNIWYFGNADPLIITIDGVDQALVIPNGTATLQAQNYSGLANIAHTIDVRRSGTGGLGMSLFGSEAVTPVVAARIFNLGISGAGAQSTGGDANFKVFLPLFLAALQPDLVHIGYAINDANVFHTTIPNYTTYQQSTITQALASGASVLMRTDHDYTGSGGALTPYRQAMYDLAASNNQLLIDVQDRLGSFATANANGLMSGDGFHLTPAGCAESARSILRAIDV